MNPNPELAPIWHVFCSPDRYCVILPNPAVAGHRKLAGPMTQPQALIWRTQHCQAFPPGPVTATTDWLCK